MWPLDQRLTCWRALRHAWTEWATTRSTHRWGTSRWLNHCLHWRRSNWTRTLINRWCWWALRLHQSCHWWCTTHRRSCLVHWGRSSHRNRRRRIMKGLLARRSVQKNTGKYRWLRAHLYWRRRRPDLLLLWLLLCWRCKSCSSDFLLLLCIFTRVKDLRPHWGSHHDSSVS
jgi:hypothetical protein